MMSASEEHEKRATLMDRAEGYASVPNRTFEQQSDMLRIAEQLQSCGYADIEQRALRVLAHNRLETALNLIQGFASNPTLKPGDYADMIPTAEKLLNCGFDDIEKGAQEVIEELTKRQNAKKRWQFWK